MNFWLLCLFLSLANASVFNDFLENKVFGQNPGPCPFDDGSCALDLRNDLPEGIRNIEFCLVDAFILRICDELEDWVTSGVISLFEVKCRDAAFSEISISPKEVSQSSVNSNFAIEGLVQRCEGKVRFDRVRLDADLLTVTLSLVSDFVLSEVEGGVDISFDLILTAEGEGGFDENLVDKALIENCDVSIGLTLDLNDAQFSNAIDLNFGGFLSVPIESIFIQSAFIRLLEVLVRTLFENLNCDLIEQAGVLEDQSDGFLNQILNDLNVKYDELTLPVEINVDQTEVDFITNPEDFSSNFQEVNDALDLSQSDTVELFSRLFNIFLGDPSVDPLRVNQAINFVTDPDGDLFLDFSSLDLAIELPLEVSNVDVRATSLTLKGLNSIDSFQFLQNDFTNGGNGKKFTLFHEFEIDDIEILINLEFKMKRGEWVTESSCGNLLPLGFPSEEECSSDQETFSFDFGVTANSFSFSAATLSALNFKEIENLQVGQIIDNDFTDFFESMEKVLSCLSPGIYALFFSDLSANIEFLSDAFVGNFVGEGVESLVSNSVELFNALIKNLLVNDLSLLLQGPARERLNQVLESVLSSELECQRYRQEESENPFVVFNQEPVSGLFPAISSLLGNFEEDSEINLNDALQDFIQFLSQSSDSFPLESAGNKGDWNIKENLKPLSLLSKFNEETSFLSFSDFRIRNLDTFNFFQVKSRKNFLHGLDFAVALEESGSVLLLEFEFKFVTFEFDETFVVSAELGGLSLSTLIDILLLNSDSFNLLKLSELSLVSCLQALIDGFFADPFSGSLSSKTIDISISFPSETSPSSDLKLALQALNEDIAASEGTPGFTKIANYFLEIGFQRGLQTFNEFDYSRGIRRCDRIEPNFGVVFDLFLGVSSFNASFFTDVCLQEIPDLLSFEEFELQTLKVDSFQELDSGFLNFEESFVAEILSGLFNTVGGSQEDKTTLNQLLNLFASSSGNLFVDAFSFDENEDVVVEINLKENQEFFQVFGINLPSFKNDEGFIAEAQSLRILNLNNSLEQLQLFQVASLFTTKNVIRFSDNVEEAIKVEVDFLLQVNASVFEESDEEIIKDFVTVSFDLTGGKVDFDLMTAFNAKDFTKLSVGHLVSIDEDQVFSLTNEAFDCVLESFHPNGLSLRSFEITFGEISVPNVENEETIISSSTINVLQEFLAVFADFYVDAIPNICQNCLKNIANEQLLFFRQQATGKCPSKPSITPVSAENEIFRFSESEVYREFQDFLNDFVFSNDYRLWNEIIAGITKDSFFGQGEEFTTGDLDLFYQDQSYGSLELIFEFLRISNLDSFTFVDFFKPIFSENKDLEPFTLSLAFNIEGATLIETLQTVIGRDLFQENEEVVNQIELDFSLRNLTFAVSFAVEVNVNSLLRVQFDQVNDFSEVPCLLTPIRNYDVFSFDFKVQELNATINCPTRCDAELLDLFTSGGAVTSSDPLLVEAFDNILRFILEYLETPPGERLIDIFFVESDEDCTSLDPISEDFFSVEDPDFLNTTVSVFAFSFFSIFLALFLIRSKHNREIKAKKEVIGSLEISESRKTKKLTLLEKKSLSLANDSSTPLWFKLLLPGFCAANVVGICFAVLELGVVTIIIDVTLLSLQLNRVEVVPFSIISIVRDVWEAKAYLGAIFMATFSFLLPLALNFPILLLFYAPSTVICRKTRARWIEIVASLGKFGFVSLCVVVILLGALLTSLNLASQDELQFLAPEILDIVVSLRAERGIFLLTFMTTCSIFISQLLGFFSRSSLAAFRKEIDKVNKIDSKSVPKTALLKTSITSYRFRRRVSSKKSFRILFFLHLFSAFLSILGQVLPVLVFEVEGIVGFLASEVNDVKRQFSVSQLGTLIQEAPRGDVSESLVLLFLQFVFFSTSIIFPFAQFVCISLLLAGKFTLKNLEALMNFSMIAFFWSSLDVLLVGIPVTLLSVTEITAFVVSFITDDICNNVQGALETFAPEEESDNCLAVVGRLDVGYLPLLLGTFGQSFVFFVTMIVTKRVVTERYFFTFVKGRRVQEGVPLPLPRIRNFVFEMFTKEKENNRNDQGWHLREQLPEERIEVEAANPRFSKEVQATPVTDELFAQMERTSYSANDVNDEEADIFALMEKKSKRWQKKVSPPSTLAPSKHL